jgi:hypothetical protein
MKQFVFYVLFVTYFIYAQTISINGKVTNQSGTAIQGVVVELLGAKIKDTTESDGTFSLTGQVTQVNNYIEKKISKIIIGFVKNSFLIEFPYPTYAKISIYNVKGILLENLYKGKINKKIIIPANLKKYGNKLLIVRIKTLKNEYSFKLTPILEKATYLIENYYTNPLAKVSAVDWISAVKQGYSSHVEPVNSYTGTINIVLSAASSSAPNFGSNVYVFDASTTNIQTTCNTVFSQQERAQFGTGRYAFLFKPGTYSVDVNVGYYTEVLGLGELPSAVQINGAVRAEADWFGGNATHNFWRSCANLTVTPSSSTLSRWAVSQAAPFRRMHIKGSLALDDGGWSSGGFIADSKIDQTINSGSQQQWFTRNTEEGGWNGGVWNMFFMGVINPPSGEWPSRPYTTIDQVPIIREKPYLYVDNNGNYFIKVPAIRRNAKGNSWSTGVTEGTSIPLDLFYIAKADVDSATTINAALAQGKNLLITPGIYYLNEPIQIIRPNTVVLGIGIPSLVANRGNIVVKVSDVDGVILAGFLVDGGGTSSPTLVEVGPAGSSANHSANPISLHDVFIRLGGQFVGKASCCLTINSNDVIVDHTWIWRADHGSGVGWTSNTGANGLIVNGNNVYIYGLFVEHYQEYQTIWNGNGGKCYFYQCEMPYDPPNQSSWQHDGVNGWAGYKVSNNVTSHEAWGLGIYCAFRNPVVADNAIESPNNPNVKFRNMVTVFLGGSQGPINNVINGTGGPANSSNGTRRLLAYP